MSYLIRKFIFLIQFLLVVTFIIFEELIWESIAIPIYNYLHSLKILKKLEYLIKNKINRYILLSIFVAIFLIVEIAGIIAGVLIVGGYPLIGVTIYITKIPIAGFTFWLFNVGRDKLMTFKWFAISYKKILEFVEWIKMTQVYQSTLKMWKRLKEYLRNLKDKVIREGEQSSDNSFIKGLRRVYRVLKKRKRS